MPMAARAVFSASAPLMSTRTVLPASANACTRAATSRRGLSRSPPHSSRLSGQAVQMAFCGAHSAGTLMLVSILLSAIANPSKSGITRQRCDVMLAARDVKNYGRSESVIKRPKRGPAVACHPAL